MPRFTLLPVRPGLTVHRQIPWQRLAIPVAAVVAFAVYALIFLPYLPSMDGRGGPDYGYFLPQLLAGYFWFEQNGPFSIPWFTPAFCGGIPYYPNMQGMYLSLPQYLTFVVGPIRALQLTFLAFAGAGFAGTYLLLRKTFAATSWAALAGAVLFLFNGFFAARFLVGHLAFHAFTLTPLVAACVLASERPGATRRLLDPWVLVGGLCFGYMVQSGMVHALPPALVGIVVIILVHAVVFGLRAAPFVRLAAAGAIGLALSAAKLTAAVAFLAQFPRDMLPLAGFDSLWHVLALTALSLFVAPTPAFVLGADWIRNVGWYENARVVLSLHEYDYGVTYIPALVICGWLAWQAIQVLRQRPYVAPERHKLALIGTIALLLVLPVALNWYQPEWNAFLKTLPVFRNSSTLIRWICLYVLVVVFFAALAVDRLPFTPWMRAAAAFSIVGAVVVLNLGADRSYYRSYFWAWNRYDFRPVDDAFRAVESGSPVPAIDHIDWRAAPDTYKERMVRRDRNDSMIQGGSQANCYEPMFGFKLEAFPFGALREGPVLEERDGLLNVKNPACFVYPEQNACHPGDQFAAEDIEAATHFVNYRPFPFVMPWWQRIADWLNVAVLVATLGGLAGYAVRALRPRLRLQARRMEAPPAE